MLAGLGAGDAVEPWQIDIEHLAVQKQQGGEGLVLRAGGYVADRGQVGQKRLDLGRAYVARMALAVEKDVALDPVRISLFGPQAVMPGADRRAYLAHQTRRLSARRRCRVLFDDGRHGAGLRFFVVS